MARERWRMLGTMILRNLLRYRKRNLIVLALSTLIVFLLFMGNSFIHQSNRALENDYVRSFSGDLVIKEPSDMPFGLFGASIPTLDEYFTLPVLERREALEAVLAAEPAVEDYCRQVSGVGLVELGGPGAPAPLFGVEAADYFALFKAARVEPTAAAASAGPGAFITQQRAARIENLTGTKPKPGDPVRLTMYNAFGIAIREVPLAGILAYENPNQLLQEIVIADAATVRALNAIAPAGASGREAGQAPMQAIDEQSLFGGESLVAPSQGGTVSLSALQRELSAGRDTASAGGSATNGAWHFLVLRLKAGSDRTAVRERLNQAFSAAGMTARAVDWREAAGVSAMFVLLLQFAFNGGFILVAFAGVMAVVNMLLVSLFDRTTEIGTLRAMGAPRSSIVVMVLAENLILALSAAVLALLGGFVVLELLNSANITVSNRLMVMLLGQNTIKASFDASIALFSIAAAVILGLASALYPTIRAVSIQPVVAVQKGQG